MNPQINIPQPCPENWANMIPRDNGRYCSSCDKVVVDFAAMTNEEIKQYFLNKPVGNACGSFYKHQVAGEKSRIKKILLKLYQSSENNIKQQTARWICLLVIGFTLSLMGCRQKRLAGAYAYDNSSIRNLDELSNKNRDTKVDSVIVLKRN